MRSMHFVAAGSSFLSLMKRRLMRTAKRDRVEITAGKIGHLAHIQNVLNLVLLNTICPTLPVSNQTAARLLVVWIPRKFNCVLDRIWPHLALEAESFKLGFLVASLGE